ncbi:MAG TPA: hypothetical protein VFF52_00210, partial [Isosphaeraceae bacterium]|nr:hypothetical protein [Isosphaeraceae bacterium]
APDSPDRLALTELDRRLESSVLLQLVRSGNGTDRQGSRRPPSSRWPESIADLDSPDEIRIRDHALSITAFLAGEYQAATFERQWLVAELAVEMAQRLEEAFLEVASSASVGAFPAAS